MAGDLVQELADLKEEEALRTAEERLDAGDSLFYVLIEVNSQYSSLGVEPVIEIFALRSRSLNAVWISARQP